MTLAQFARTIPGNKSTKTSLFSGLKVEIIILLQPKHKTVPICPAPSSHSSALPIVVTCGDAPYCIYLIVDPISRRLLTSSLTPMQSGQKGYDDFKLMLF